MKAKHVQVLVRRDMAEVISTGVFEHEVDILCDIHGDGNIEVIDSDYPVIEIDENEEFDRLKMVYGTNDANQPYVERTIGYKASDLLAYEVTDDAPKSKRKAKADE